MEIPGLDLLSSARVFQAFLRWLLSICLWGGKHKRCFKRKEFGNKIRSLMEFLKQYEKEYMKKAMMKHEETFREQVSELHRIYRVQKLLMRGVRNSELMRLVESTYLQTESKISSGQSAYRCKEQDRSGRLFNLELSAEEYIQENKDVMPKDAMPASEEDIDLTLAIGQSKRKEDTSFTSDSGTSFPSSSTTDSGTEDLKLHGDWGLTMMPMNCPNQKTAFGMEGAMRQNRLEQPSWHIQCLSLNMT